MSLNKILIVDDSDLIHNMYRLMLKKYEGATIIGAKNGTEALDKLSTEPGIELILLDINMPVMNGIQFLETIKQEGKHTNIPIIIISTEGKEEDTLRGLSLGAKGYIVKPFKSTDLYNLVDKVLSKLNQ